MTRPWTATPTPSALPHTFFFFNDTATTEIYTLSLHDALPISSVPYSEIRLERPAPETAALKRVVCVIARSEEHTSELQSRLHLVCRLLLEKKNRRNERYVFSLTEGIVPLPATGLFGCIIARAS